MYMKRKLLSGLVKNSIMCGEMAMKVAVIFLKVAS